MDHQKPNSSTPACSVYPTKGMRHVFNYLSSFCDELAKLCRKQRTASTLVRMRGDGKMPVLSSPFPDLEQTGARSWNRIDAANTLESGDIHQLVWAHANDVISEHVSSLNVEWQGHSNVDDYCLSTVTTNCPRVHCALERVQDGNKKNYLCYFFKTAREREKHWQKYAALSFRFPVSFPLSRRPERSLSRCGAVRTPLRGRGGLNRRNFWKHFCHRFTCMFRPSVLRIQRRREKLRRGERVIHAQKEGINFVWLLLLPLQLITSRRTKLSQLMCRRKWTKVQKSKLFVGLPSKVVCRKMSLLGMPPKLFGKKVCRQNKETRDKKKISVAKKILCK